MINIGQNCKINDALWICTISYCLVCIGRTMDAIVLCCTIWYFVFGSLFFFSFCFVCFLVSFSSLIGWQGRCLKLALMFSARAPLSASSEKKKKKSPYLFTHHPRKKKTTPDQRRDRKLIKLQPVKILTLLHPVSDFWSNLENVCIKYINIYILYIHVVKHLYEKVVFDEKKGKSGAFFFFS